MEVIVEFTTWSHHITLFAYFSIRITFLASFLTPLCVCPIKACGIASLRTRSHAIWLKFPSADWHLVDTSSSSIFSLNERKTNKSRGCSQGVVCAGITTNFKFLARAVSSTALCKWAWHASRSSTQSRFGNTCAKILHKVSKYSIMVSAVTQEVIRRQSKKLQFAGFSAGSDATAAQRRWGSTCSLPGAEGRDQSSKGTTQAVARDFGACRFTCGCFGGN